MDIPKLHMVLLPSKVLQDCCEKQIHQEQLFPLWNGNLWGWKIKRGFDDEDIEIREDILPTANPQFSQFEEEPVIEGQKQIDDLFKFLSETELNKQAQKMISPLLSLLENCESYEEAFELLTDKNLHTKQLEQSIQKALFLCELQGRSDGLDD